MQPNGPWTAGTDESPIKVLLLGNRWEAFEPAMTDLVERGTVEFVGRSGEDWKEVVSRQPLPVMAVAPDFATTGIESLRAGEHPFSPLVLLFGTPEMLEWRDLYQEADDFLVAPSTAAELGHRIRRLAMCRQADPSPNQLQMGQITLLLDTYQVLLGNRRVDLAWMEFKLLRFLMENPSRVFSREQLLAHVWGVESFVGTRTVDVHIRRLRSKLGVRGDEYFRTVKNVGYGLVEP